MPINYKRGDRVILEVTKTGSLPPSRRRNMIPAEHGETYCFVIELCGTVLESGDNVRVRFENGKTQILKCNDPRLSKPGLMALLLRFSRFPRVKSRGRFPSQGLI
ncbi:MAG: hypothetical protein K9N51_06870 [Candidatus Pacebacteria bacterium]|nr:hypothetical protein [Candidatus Paceibacterota bacterium]